MQISGSWNLEEPGDRAPPGELPLSGSAPGHRIGGRAICRNPSIGTSRRWARMSCSRSRRRSRSPPAALPESLAGEASKGRWRGGQPEWCGEDKLWTYRILL